MSQVGQAKIVRESGKDRALVVGAGITLHEALAAADQLKDEGTLYIFLELPIHHKMLSTISSFTDKS